MQPLSKLGDIGMQMHFVLLLQAAYTSVNIPIMVVFSEYLAKTGGRSPDPQVSGL